MTPRIFSEPILFSLGRFPVTATMATSAATSSVLVIVGALMGLAVERNPGGRFAAAGRLTFRFLRDLVSQAAGRTSPVLEVFAGSLFLFISGAAVLGQLPGITAPTSNVAATSALAALVFLAVPIAGVHARGLWGYVKHYFQPNPILFPLEIISEISRTLALSLRLFGNMLSGHMVVALLVALVGLVIPVPLMALDLLIGFLQAYIFTILASVYIGAAIRVGEGERG